MTVSSSGSEEVIIRSLSLSRPKPVAHPATYPLQVKCPGIAICTASQSQSDLIQKYLNHSTYQDPCVNILTSHCVLTQVR